MRALQLFSPANVNEAKSNACLLIYAESEVYDSTISADIKEIYENRPSTAHIYILAPFANTNKTIDNLCAQSAALLRSQDFTEGQGSFNVLKLKRDGTKVQTISVQLQRASDGETVRSEVALDHHLRNAWLFDLFNQKGGLVAAPLGVHYRKQSGKHTDSFLRTSNILLSSNICGLLAFFAIGHFGSHPPRQILVDTAPLISVAQAVFAVAAKSGLWTEPVPIKSFSSYGGLNSISRLSKSDWVLLSASTSGSLATELKERGVDSKHILTLYYLQSENSPPLASNLLCDLTHRTGSNLDMRH